MFAVGIDNIDLNSPKRFFTVTVEKKFKRKATLQAIPVKLVQCNIEDWNQVSSNFTATFNRVGFS